VNVKKKELRTNTNINIYLRARTLGLQHFEIGLVKLGTLFKSSPHPGSTNAELLVSQDASTPI